MRQTRNPESVTNITPSWAVDVGAYQLLLRPPAINNEDDHFDNPALNSKWTGWNSPTLYPVSLPGWIGMTSGGTYLRGLIQPVVSGDWTIETETIWGTESNSSFWGANGLFLTNSTNAASSLAATITSGGRASVGMGRINCTKFTNASYTSNYLEVLSATLALDHQFFRIKKTSTTYFFSFSTTGKTWIHFYSANSTTLGFTPTYFGICTLTFANQPAYFNYFLRY